MDLPESVAVIGGGRWARVLTSALLDLLAKTAQITVHSRGNAAGMMDWARSRGFAKRLRCVADLPRYPGPQAVVIANAAKDHEAAALDALDAGVPVFLEKPLAPSAQAAERIVERARQRGAVLAASQVFAFARYIERFAALVKETGALQALDFRWADPVGEIRHGEVKRQDESLAVFSDVIPHIAAIVSAVAGAPPDACLQAQGSLYTRVETRLTVNGLPLSARIERGAPRRVRLVRALAADQELALDFAAEPGTIIAAGRQENGDPLWESAPRPVTAMLSAFLNWAGGGCADLRLDPAVALAACRLADQVAAKLR